MGSLPQSIGQGSRAPGLQGSIALGQLPHVHGEISEQLQISSPVVFKWRKRYQEASLGGRNDLPCSREPRKLSVEKIKEILTLTPQRVLRRSRRRPFARVMEGCELELLNPAREHEQRLSDGQVLMHKPVRPMKLKTAMSRLLERGRG